jgi:hypothetical protein
MPEQEKIPGYVRCGVTHATDEWRFEVLDESVRVGFLVVATGEGELSFGIRRQSAEALMRSLRLFLEDQTGG